ncbi:MAG: serine hydrolase [Anaerolineales bacterium]|nr:serine hydrolase [Anaerolineales bacterium]
MLYNQLTTTLQEIVARWQVPGLSVGIVQDGEIIFSHVMGVQSLFTKTPVSAATRFCVASIAKIFVASAVMRLVEDGCIDLDAPICEYLHYFTLNDERYTRITVCHILSHTSGLPDLDEFEYNALWENPEFDEAASERYVRGLKGLELRTSPGEEFHYSNLAFNVLGDLITKVSGSNFESYLQTRVLAPAGMPDSTFLLSEVPSDLLAVPHIHIPEKAVSPIYPYHRADAPSSTLHSTLGDMCHWAIMCLDGGRFRGEAVLQPDTIERMWTPVARRGGILYADMGLGWNLGTYRGQKAVSHGGMGAGLTDFFVLLPEKKLGAIMMCNEESYAIARVREAVLDVMVGMEPRVGSVSWMLPISQALLKGGREAACACSAQLRASESKDYEVDEESLLMLAMQLEMVGRLELAIDVLGLNIQAFPEFFDTYILLANVYRQMGSIDLAEGTLQKALALDAGNLEALALLKKLVNN